MNDEGSLINDEYSVHLYTISSSTIADLMVSTITDSIEEIIDLVHVAVRKVSGDDSTESLDGGRQKMKDLISERTDSLQSRLRTFLFQTLLVPPYVLLPGDENQRERKTLSAKARLEKEIHKMEKELKNATYMKAALSAELETGNQILSKLQQTFDCISRTEQAIVKTEDDSSVLSELCEGIKNILQVENKTSDIDLCCSD